MVPDCLFRRIMLEHGGHPVFERVFTELTDRI